MSVCEMVDELLPSPIVIDISFALREFNRGMDQHITEMLERHNDGYVTQVDEILTRRDRELEKGDFCVYIGKNLVYKGHEEDRGAYDEMVLDVLDEMLNTYHDVIVGIQDENERKLAVYEKERYDELLFEYYRMHEDRKAFIHLKRLGYRYPNSKYSSLLQRVYLGRQRKWHGKDLNLKNKITWRNFAGPKPKNF